MTLKGKINSDNKIVGSIKQSAKIIGTFNNLTKDTFDFFNCGDVVGLNSKFKEFYWMNVNGVVLTDDLSTINSDSKKYNILYFPQLYNKAIVFANPFVNTKYSKMCLLSSVPSGATGAYNVSNIRLSTEFNPNNSDINNGKTGQTGSKYKTFFLTYHENRIYTLPLQIIKLDISNLIGETFYIGLHNCDCEWVINSIWFEV